MGNGYTATVKKMTVQLSLAMLVMNVLAVGYLKAGEKHLIRSLVKTA